MVLGSRFLLSLPSQIDKSLTPLVPLSQIRCIWDLRTKKPSGWRLTGANCFEQFTSPHDCDEWLYQKPTIFLPPPSVNLKNLSPNEVLLASTEHTNRIDPNQQEEDDDGHMKFRLQDNGGSDIVEKEEERQPDEEQATDANER